MLNIDLKETAETLKTKAIQANKDVVKASDKIVEETIAAGENWQKVLGKALKTGTTILGQQQEVALTAIEGVKDQYVKGGKRFAKLLGVKYYSPEEMVNEAKESIGKAKKAITTTATNVTGLVEVASRKVEKSISDVANRVTDEVENAPKTAKKVLSTTAKKVEVKAVTTKKVLTPTTKKVATAANKTEEVASSVVKKTVAKKAPSKKMELETINGVGPKMAVVLAENGLTTINELANANAEDLAKTLLALNKRYAMYDVAAWVEEAKKMA